MRARVDAVEHLRGPKQDRLGGSGRDDSGDGCGNRDEETHHKLPRFAQPKRKATAPPRELPERRAWTRASG
jgi:hypothetical protein